MLSILERALLVQASKVIERGTHVHLCYALGTAAHELAGGTSQQEAHYTACLRLRSYIMNVLEPHATLDDWILAREQKAHPDTNAQQLRVPSGREERAEARLGWIRWMLGTGKRYDPHALVLCVTRSDERRPTVVPPINSTANAEEETVQSASCG